MSSRLKLAPATLSRRQILSSAAWGGALLMLGGRPRLVRADPVLSRRFIFVYFEGGWDMLLGLDPRDPAVTNPASHQIDPSYSALGAPYNTRGVQRAGNLSFGPAMAPQMLAHAQDVSIIRGISMDTAAHEVGRRFFLTGRFPRGLQAVGSSTPAEIIAQVGDRVPIPHMSAGVESYAEGVPSYAAALGINSLVDLIIALTPLVAVDGDIKAALEMYQDAPAGCEAQRMDSNGLVTSLKRSQQRSRDYITRQLGDVFNLDRRTVGNPNQADPAMMALRQLYGTDAVGLDPASPEVLALVAGQAVKEGISQCVSVRLGSGLDTHTNWAQDQAPRQERGWRALAALLTDLKNTPLPENSTKNFLDDTTVMVFSEFARTPLMNNTRGRDHFLGNACMLAGPGLRRGVTVGESAVVGMMPLHTDLTTGLGVANPTAAQLDSDNVVMMTPRNVLATVMAASGMNHDYLRAQPIRGLMT